MNVEKNEAIERVTTTVLKLTSADIIDALAKGNARLFKGADVEVTVMRAYEPGDRLCIEAEDVLVVTIKQTVTRQKAAK